MYPFSLFAKAANGQSMTPWERSQYKLWQVIGTTAAAFIIVNMDVIKQLMTDPGSTDIWYTVRAQLLVPLLVALFLAFLKYQGAKTDISPPAGQSLKIKTSAGVPNAYTGNAFAQAIAGKLSDVGNRPGPDPDPLPPMPPMPPDPSSPAPVALEVPAVNVQAAA